MLVVQSLNCRVKMAFFTKSVSELVKNAILTRQFNDWTTSILPYLFVVGMFATVLTNVNFLNQGLAKFDALLVVPIYQSFWNAFGITGGLVFFQEYQYMSQRDGVFYSLGIAITMVGVYMLVRERKGETKGHQLEVGLLAEDQQGESTATKTEEHGLIRHRKIQANDEFKSNV